MKLLRACPLSRHTTPRASFLLSPLCRVLLGGVFVAGTCLQAEPRTLRVAMDDGVRTALVFPSSISPRPSPLVIYFHGFTGTSQDSADRSRLHEIWPEATVAYPQGLDVRDGKGVSAPGWQRGPGHLNDRDVRFFDRLLAALKKDYPIEPRAVFVTGHSSGGFFTFALYRERAGEITAFAPVSCYAASGCFTPTNRPRPVIYWFGSQDNVFDNDSGKKVPGMTRAQSTTASLLQVNRSDLRRRSLWGGNYLAYPPITTNGAQTVICYYPGGHGWPADASSKIVDFFRKFVPPK